MMPSSTRVVDQRQSEAPGRVPDANGAWTPLVDRGEVIGVVLRTRAGVKPLYVSIGHRVSLATAVRCVMACVTRYRLPEPTRWARRLAASGAKGAWAVR